MPRLDDIDFHLFIESLTRTIELKDMYTAGHSRRVSEICEQLCLECGLSSDDCEYLHVVGHVHDIGKIGIADGILMKSGKLSHAEHLLMQQHTVIGASIFENLPGLDQMADIIRHHHERFDGKGYPDGLKGGAIPLESAIIAVADSFDAMTTYRPYKAALTLEQAYDEIRRNRGTQFHPGVCDLFLDLLERNPDGFHHSPCRNADSLRHSFDACPCRNTPFCPTPPAEPFIAATPIS
ncbi:HD-GYP domain-containing protein [Desulfobulbus propionicus]|jgi:HD-GYP domain-containing protein (c-di-GMP phosphodiesterase class II)